MLALDPPSHFTGIRPASSFRTTPLLKFLPLSSRVVRLLPFEEPPHKPTLSGSSWRQPRSPHQRNSFLVKTSLLYSLPYTYLLRRHPTCSSTIRMLLSGSWPERGSSTVTQKRPKR